MAGRVHRVRRVACALAVFLASVTALSGPVYGASLLLRATRPCGNGCENVSTAMPVLYVDAGDSGRTFRVAEGQVVYVHLTSVGPTGYLFSDSDALLDHGAVNEMGDRFVADRPGTARILLAKRAPCAAQGAAACPAGFPAALIDPRFEVTVIVGG